ncbi:hypothetical protein [Solirhodobacter olei]|uniref:hypothetical protein n=1 Tax=Solirhodobacter olei TaxID=2493082 RepID=UPI000FDC2498|nr:hypothetical protein [Solirhodobacter olei]
MRRLALLLPVLALAACATPRERCIADATHDLTVVNQLIAQLEGDLDRGYALKEHQTIVPLWRPCFPPPRRGFHGRDGWHDEPGPTMCWQDTVQTTTHPVAIDLAQTKRTLAGLKAKRAELNRRAGPAIAACQATYPE